MQHRRTFTLVMLAFAGAGLVPAALAGASDRSPTTGGENYCSAHLGLEAAVSSEDPEDDGPAVEAAQAAAPDEIADALTTAIENAPTDGPPAPEFYEAYGAVIDWVRGNCGFAELEVLAQDYSFGGIGGEVAAGPTVIDLVNEGLEYHEIILMRRSEDATQPVEELLALPEEELGSLLTFVGAAFAAPGTTGSTVVDLTPGDYIALCFVPVGATEEAMADMMATAGSMPPESVAGPGTAPADTATEDTTVITGSMVPGDSMAPGELGPPHFTQGMFVEFTVVEDGAADTGAVPADTSGAGGTIGDTTADTSAETTTAGTTADTTGDTTADTSIETTTAGTEAAETTTG